MGDDGAEVLDFLAKLVLETRSGQQGGASRGLYWVRSDRHLVRWVWHRRFRKRRRRRNGGGPAAGLSLECVGRNRAGHSASSQGIPGPVHC